MSGINIMLYKLSYWIWTMLEMQLIFSNRLQTLLNFYQKRSVQFCMNTTVKSWLGQWTVLWKANGILHCSWSMKPTHRF